MHEFDFSTLQRAPPQPLSASARPCAGSARAPGKQRQQRQQQQNTRHSLRRRDGSGVPRGEDAGMMVEAPPLFPAALVAQLQVLTPTMVEKIEWNEQEKNLMRERDARIHARRRAVEVRGAALVHDVRVKAEKKMMRAHRGDNAALAKRVEPLLKEASLNL